MSPPLFIWHTARQDPRPEADAPDHRARSSNQISNGHKRETSRNTSSLRITQENFPHTHTHTPTKPHSNPQTHKPTKTPEYPGNQVHLVESASSCAKKEPPLAIPPPWMSWTAFMSGSHLRFRSTGGYKACEVLGLEGMKTCEASALGSSTLDSRLSGLTSSLGLWSAFESGSHFQQLHTTHCSRFARYVQIVSGVASMSTTRVQGAMAIACEFCFERPTGSTKPLAKPLCSAYLRRHLETMPGVLDNGQSWLVVLITFSVPGLK